MSQNKPQFGNLQGLKVVSATSALAGPFAAVLLAENGADVIHIESSKIPDTLRNYQYLWGQEHRNERQFVLDIPSIRGREIFERLIKQCDIFMESSKGGTYDKWGLSDEVLWQMNPKLVIVHISGYGTDGDPKYVSRASYDFTGQAFSGYALQNGYPEPEPPQNAKPNLCDYVLGFQAVWAALAALYKAEKTGVGESIDVAQYEAMLRIEQYHPIKAFMEKGYEVERYSGLDNDIAGDAYYKSKDGKWVSIHMAGIPTFKRGLPIIGLGDDPRFAKVQSIRRSQWGNEMCDTYVEAIRKFASEHTADEIDEIMNNAQVPCSKLMTYEDMLSNSHYQARKDVIEYYAPCYEKTIKGFNAFPKFKNNPQIIWRGGADYGADNEEILEELGYNANEIKSFYEEKIIAKKEK